MSANGKRKPSFLSVQDEEEEEEGEDTGGGGGNDHRGGGGDIDSLGLKDLADDDEFPIDLKVKSIISQLKKKCIRMIRDICTCSHGFKLY